MKLPNRKVRIALILAIAVLAAWVAWRTNAFGPATKPCVAGREEIKDPSGKVIEVKRTTCA